MTPEHSFLCVWLKLKQFRACDCLSEESCSGLHFCLKSLQMLCFSGSGSNIHGCVEPKRLETEASAGHHVVSANCSPPLDLNFPLPGEKGPACLVKVREGEVMSRAVLSVRQTISLSEICRHRNCLPSPEFCF